MTSTIALKPQLDIEYTRVLWAALQAERGKAVTIECTAVVKVGVLAAQVLLVAAQKWRSENLAFRLSGSRAGLDEGLALLGLNISMLSEGDAK